MTANNLFIRATAGERIAGGIIDLIITFMLALIIGYPFGWSTFSTGTTASVMITSWGCVFSLGIVFLLITFLEYFTGKTPGKLVVGMYVADEETGGKITFKQSLTRNMLRFIDFIIFYIAGFIVMLCTGKKRQRIGDLVAKTVVISTLAVKQVNAATETN